MNNNMNVLLGQITSGYVPNRFPKCRRRRLLIRGIRGMAIKQRDHQTNDKTGTDKGIKSVCLKTMNVIVPNNTSLVGLRSVVYS